jgi:hypothetical protein
MIDFTDYKYGTKLNMTLSDSESEVQVAAIVEEIEFAPNRLPFLVHLMLDESEDTSKWPNKSKITLEVKCDEAKEQMFLLDCPTKLGSSYKTIRCKAKIHLN